MSNSIEWADVEHPFPAAVLTRARLQASDPENPLLDEDWQAAVLLDSVAVYSYDLDRLRAWFAKQTALLQKEARAALPLAERPSITMESVGGTDELTVDELRDLLESDQNADEALQALSGRRRWTHQDRLVEHGPRGYQEFWVSDHAAFAAQLTD